MATPRYLTAQKISLLVLTRLYCSSGLPPSATIPVLSLVLAGSLPAVSSVAKTSPYHRYDQEDALFSVNAFEDVLQDHASGVPGRTLLDIFLKQMWEMNSLDSLYDLFDAFKELVDTPPKTQEEDSVDRIHLTKTSPLGAFVRRARLEFTRLQFEDAVKLWSSFIIYRAPTAQWTKRIAGLASMGIDMVMSEMGLGPDHDMYRAVYGHLKVEGPGANGSSLDDLDRVLDFQLDRLQRFGDRVPESMRSQLRSMVSSPGVVNRQAHLLQFFDAWKAGDYTSAFDHLHRYYDYAMQTQEKIYCQYALLHTAILQADFGCFGEAIATINETIATARENQDMACLSFSLSWLSHMTKAYPKQMKDVGYMNMLGSERDALAFLKAKAKETKMHYLLRASLLNEAKLCLATGGSTVRAFENIFQSSHLNIKEGINAYGSQMLLTSTIYSRLGIPHLADTHCKLLLDCYEQTCLIDERIRAIGRRASIMSQIGCWDDAINTLQAFDTSTHSSLKFRQYITFYIGFIKLRRAIRRSDWSRCEHLLATLKPTTDMSPSPLDAELSFLQYEVYIEYLISRGLRSQAYTTIAALSQSLKSDNADLLQRVSVLLMQADLWRKAGRPERGFSVALRAASVSFRARLGPCLWTAVGLLGNILNALGEYEGSKHLIESVLPQALEGGDSMLLGDLYSHLADSYMGLASPPVDANANETFGSDISPASMRSRATQVGNAERNIDCALKWFTSSGYLRGQCEQLMKKAIVAKLRGDEQLADQWAQEHNRIWEEGISSTHEEA